MSLNCPHCNKKLFIALSNDKPVRIVKTEKALLKMMKDDAEKIMKECK